MQFTKLKLAFKAGLIGQSVFWLKRVVLVVCLSLLVSLIVVEPPPILPDYIDRDRGLSQMAAWSTAHECRYTGGRYQNELFRYRLLAPDPIDPNEQYPLIVWLHGAGPVELQDDNIGQMLYIYEMMHAEAGRTAHPCYVLAMQCPKDNPIWFHSAEKPSLDSPVEKGDEPMTVTMEILDMVVSGHQVDTDRIYVIGISSGGSGAWEIGMRYPDRFAAIVPLASDPKVSPRLKKLIDIPIWAFHSVPDKKTSPDAVRNMVSSLQRAGGNAYLTEIPSSNNASEGVTHDCWNTAFRHYGLLPWLLSQRRGAEGPSPGSVPLPLTISLWKKRLLTKGYAEDTWSFVWRFSLLLGMIGVGITAVQRERQRCTV